MPDQFTYEDAVAPADTGFSFQEAHPGFSFEEGVLPPQNPQLELPAGVEPGKPGEKSIYEEPTWMDKPLVPLGDALFDTSGAVTQPKMGRIAGAIPEQLSPTQQGISETMKGAVNSLTTPRNLAYMLGSMGVASTGTAGKILVSSLWTGLMGKNAVEDAPQIATALGEEMAKPEGERDQKKIASLLTQGGIDAAMVVAPALHAAGEFQLGDRPGQQLETFQQQAAQELPQQTEVPNASSQQETTGVHGDLQPFSFESAREMPTTESGEGVQPQTEGGIHEPPKPDTTKEEVVLGQPEKQIPLGAATAEEFPAEPGDPDTYGIAERVRAERARAGTVSEVEPGTGIAAPDSVERGRQLIESGANPEVALTNFEESGKLGHDDMAMVRAEGERLFKESRMTEERFGTDSDEYRAAWKKLSDWDQRTKPMQTEWHKIGQAQQGETDIDTGSFTGLQREYKSATGEDFDPKQTEKAQKVAKEVKTNQNATEKAAQTYTDYIREKTDSLSAAEKRALDAAHKTVRENAIRIANAENKSRVAKSAQEKKFAEQDRADAQKKMDEANRIIRQNAIDAARKANKERVAKADLPTYVWTKAREYLDLGITNFDDIRHKLATDLGMPVKQVTEAMGKDKRAKFLQDDLWKKQQAFRQLHQQAKRWLLAEQIPAFRKYMQTVPSALFTVKVMGHGTVALGTHAPTVAFQPNYWSTYVKNFGRMYKMVASPSFYESQVQNLLRDPNYTTFRRAGLVNDPFQHEDYNSPDMLKGMGKLTAMGNRGYSVLKMLRQDMANQQWNKLPKTQRIAEVAEAIADGINHATGVVKVAAPKGAAVAFFAPRLELSRAAWLVADPLKAAETFLRADANADARRPTWEGISDRDRVFAINQAKEKAWVAGTFFSLLALNQGILSALNSKQKINLTDPMKSDYLKFKAAGMQLAYGNAMVAMARLPARLFVGIENEGKLNKIIYEDENVASIMFDFARSQMSPFAGTATDLAIGRDFQRRPLPRAGFGLLPGKTNMPKRLKEQGLKPYTWPEYVLTTQTPIPAEEAIREVWKHGLGMSDEQINAYMKSFAILSIMMGTGARVTEDYQK